MPAIKECDPTSLKVIKLGLQNRIFSEMTKPQFSVRRLTRELNAEGIKITAQSIRKFIKKTEQAKNILIREDVKNAKDLCEISMNYKKELQDILIEVREVKNQARDSKDYTTYNQLVGRILQGIELIAKLTGEIKNKSTVDINIIYRELDDKLETEMSHVKHIFTEEPSIIDVEAEIVEEDAELAKEKNSSGENK